MAKLQLNIDQGNSASKAPAVDGSQHSGEDKMSAIPKVGQVQPPTVVNAAGKQIAGVDADSTPSMPVSDSGIIGMPDISNPVIPDVPPPAPIQSPTDTSTMTVMEPGPVDNAQADLINNNINPVANEVEQNMYQQPIQPEEQQYQDDYQMQPQPEVLDSTQVMQPVQNDMQYQQQQPMYDNVQQMQEQPVQDNTEGKGKKKTWLTILLIAIASIVVLGGIALAVTQLGLFGNTPDEKTYATELNAKIGDYSNKIDLVNNKIKNMGAINASSLGTIAEDIKQLSEDTNTLKGDLEGMDVPDKFKDSHDKIVNSLGDTASALGDMSSVCEQAHEGKADEASVKKYNEAQKKWRDSVNSVNEVIKEINDSAKG